MKFVFDLDGTLCFRGKPLSELVVQALDRLTAKGHEVIFASARPIRDLLPVLPDRMHHYAMVGGNGAFVASGGKVLSTIHFDQQTSVHILGLIQKFKAEYLIDSRWNYAYSGSPDHPILRNVDPGQSARNVTPGELEEMVKVVILHSMDNGQMYTELQKLPVVIYSHGAENILDISPQGVNKWAGLQALGVQSQRFIAFGNDANDMEMFRHSLYSVCVGEHTGLQSLATDKVSSNEEDIVMIIGKIMEACSQEDPETPDTRIEEIAAKARHAVNPPL